MPTLSLRAAMRSEVGQRENNEDAVFASSRMLALADGVGGATSGEVASRLVIDAMTELDKRQIPHDLDDAFQRAVENGNDALGFVISCRPALAGMGTTLTAVALSDEGHYLVANVGDSRTYLYRQETLTRLTRDDSLVQALVDEGMLTESEARHHPHRSVVLEALDGSPRTPVALGRVDAELGDRLMLCSDGLSDVVEDAAIAAALATNPLEAVPERLIEMALAEGTRDNVSVVVADVVAASERSAGWVAPVPAQ